MLKEKFYPWADKISPDVSVCWATLWGLGTLRAPGTWGSAFGILFYCMFFSTLNIVAFLIFVALFAYLAAGVCDAAESALGEKDPGMINLDEFVAMPLCFMPICHASYNALWLLLGFAIFRFLDIRKPAFVARLQEAEGGAGIVLDDLACAAITGLIVNALYYVVESFAK